MSDTQLITLLVLIAISTIGLILSIIQNNKFYMNLNIVMLVINIIRLIMAHK